MNTLKCRPGTPSSSDWNRSEPAFLQRNASLFRVKSTEGSSRVQRSSAFDSGLNIFRLFAPVLRKLGRDVAIRSWMSLKRQKEKQVRKVWRSTTPEMCSDFRISTDFPFHHMILTFTSLIRNMVPKKESLMKPRLPRLPRSLEI